MTAGSFLYTSSIPQTLVLLTGTTAIIDFTMTYPYSYFAQYLLLVGIGSYYLSKEYATQRNSHVKAEEANKGKEEAEEEEEEEAEEEEEEEEEEAEEAVVEEKVVEEKVVEETAEDTETEEDDDVVMKGGVLPRSPADSNVEEAMYDDMPGLMYIPLFNPDNKIEESS
jgi:flagellar biosynthesis component FlhA